MRIRVLRTTLKHFPFHTSQVLGNAHWNALPNNAMTAQIPIRASTKKATLLSLAMGVRFRMNTARDSFEHVRLRIYRRDPA